MAVDKGLFAERHREAAAHLRSGASSMLFSIDEDTDEESRTFDAVVEEVHDLDPPVTDFTVSSNEPAEIAAWLES